MAKLKAPGPTPGACLNLGREITRMACGIAHAVRAVEKGDSGELRIGLDTASRFAGEIGRLLPSGKGAARAVENGAASIGKTVADAARKGRRIPKEESAKMLAKLRDMGGKAEELFRESSARCRNGGWK